MKLPIIGITGATGAGKGLACKILAAQGAFIIDSDAIAHSIIKKGFPAYTEILAAFPEHSYIDEHGEIIRQKLAEIIFADENKRLLLTEITHKYITKNIISTISDIRSNPNNYNKIVIDAPLLIESGLHTLCDKVIGIVADEKTRIARIMKRDKLSEEAAQQRANKQTPLYVLEKYADVIIENNCNEETFREKINGYRP